MPQLSVFLIVDNPLADKLLNGISLHQLALGEANSFAKAHGATLTEVKAPSQSSGLLKTIQNSGAEIVVIHDALRPLVSAEQFERALNALAGFDAVRPTLGFTETIKSLDSEGRLNQTIDREKVRRISSPEVIRFSAIDFAATDAGTWSVPLLADAKVTEVAADPESIRINSEAELEVMSALLSLRK